MSKGKRIIKCKDCKYFIEHYYEASLSRMAIIEDWNVCEYWERARMTEPDDYCSHAVFEGVQNHE